MGLRNLFEPAQGALPVVEVGSDAVVDGRHHEHEGLPVLLPEGDHGDLREEAQLAPGPSS